MKNYFLHFNDLPRLLASPLPLFARLSSDDARGTWNGKRENLMEFAIRLSAADGCSVDVQDGHETKLPFPHLYLKYPRSDFHSPPFAPRRAFALIYEGSLCPRLEEAGILLDTVGWPLEITTEIRGLMEKIDALCDNLLLPGSADRLDHYALCLLRELMLQHPARQGRVRKPDAFYTEKLQRIASYLRTHYTERVDLSILAAKHGLSRRTFSAAGRHCFPEPRPTSICFPCGCRRGAVCSAVKCRFRKSRKHWDSRTPPASRNSSGAVTAKPRPASANRAGSHEPSRPPAASV